MAESKLQYETQAGAPDSPHSHNGKRRRLLHQYQYADKRKREKTFDNWHYNDNMPAWKPIEAGFYYKGDDDTVECYSCGLQLKNFKKGDDPMRMHVEDRPSCDFVVHRGKTYVSSEPGTAHHDVTRVGPDSMGESEMTGNQIGESGNGVNGIEGQDYQTLQRQNNHLKEENERQKGEIENLKEENGRLKSQLEEKKSNAANAAIVSTMEFYSKELVDHAVEEYKRLNAGKEDFSGEALCKIIHEQEETSVAGGSLSAEDGNVNGGNQPLVAEGHGEATGSGNM